MSTLHRVFSEAHLRTHVQHSQHPTHIHDLLIHRGFPSLYSLSAVVAVGGDGTLHHLINGLLAAAKQSEKPIHWPSVPRIAVIPTGTGNAVAESLKLHTPLQASLNIVHALRFSRFQKPLALMRFTPEKGDTCVCVGGIQWGLPADVDFGTENIRWLGDFRFHIGALCSILKRRVVTARIEVTVHRELNDDLWRRLDAQAGQTGGRKERGMKHGLESVGEDRYILDGSFILGVAWNCTHLAEGFVVTPHAKVSELGVFDFVVFNGGICRREALAVLMNVGGGEFMNMTDRYKYFKARSVKFEKLNGRFLGVDGECRDVKPFELKMAEEDGKLCILDAFSDDC